MVERSHLERILRLNGVTIEASDETIKQILKNAHWPEEDANLAITVLRTNPEAGTEKYKVLHQVFHSDQRVEAETLNALLGIEVEVNNISEDHRRALQKTYKLQIISIVMLSILLAAAFMVGAMWWLEMEPLVSILP